MTSNRRLGTYARTAVTLATLATTTLAPPASARICETCDTGGNLPVSNGPLVPTAAQLTSPVFSEMIWSDSSGTDPRDQDHDWLKDDMESRLADLWMPYFVFDEAENDTSSNTSQLSLQSWEPRVLFQVRPVGSTWDQVVKLKINYVILYRMDGGFRNSWICTNHHSGDAERLVYNLTSYDWGTTWKFESVEGFEETGLAGTDNYRLRWTNPQGDSARPRLIVFKSAGKHHKYYNFEQCEISRSCDDDCYGGAERLTNLNPWGYFTNVGEPENHPVWSGWINQPFTNDLWHIGYPNEFTWAAAWRRSDCGDIFTGGMNPGPNNTGSYTVSSQGNTCVSPVYAQLMSDVFW
jgi:hypothetical protein